MSVLTDFFVASDRELSEAFPGWLSVAVNPELREAVNPFTGQKTTTMQWVPEESLSAKDQSLLGSEYQAISKLPHVEYRRVEHTKLALLYSISCGIEYSVAIREIEKPALIQPEDECGLHQLPASLVATLSRLDDSHLHRTASDWAEKEELQADNFSKENCLEIVQEFRRLALIAMQQDKGVFLYWSL